MGRKDTLDEVRKVLGVVPVAVERMEDEALEHWWGASREFLMVDTALPMKAKLLIGVGAAAVMRCGY